jgi:hypothetical protein
MKMLGNQGICFENWFILMLYQGVSLGDFSRIIACSIGNMHILKIGTDYNEKLNAKEIEGNVLLCTILVLSR